ncbi:putative adhesin [Chelatococcus sp.]|uniref:putative adhesin n=1 Tax=Chelatococcus sp. TaxID=1953771 RepID=UPI0034499AA3
MKCSRNIFANRVGEYVYAWTLAEGKPSSGVRACVISTHGARFHGGYFSWPDVELVFYGPEGASLVQPISTDIIGVLTETYPNYETMKRGPYPDYFLSKYQGPDETYEFLGDLPVHVAHRYSIRRPEERPASPPHPEAVALYADSGIPAYKDLVSRHGVWTMDVITVRRRGLKVATRLSTLIKTLHRHGYHYHTIHCDFCRSPLLPFREPSYSPRRRHTF